MSEAIVKITTTFTFGTDAAVTIIKSRLNDFTIDDMCREVVKGTKDAMTVEVLDYQALNKTKERRLFNVLLITDYEDFEPIPKFFDEKSLDYNGFLIVAFMNSSAVRRNHVVAMLNDLWTQKVLNAIVLTKYLDDDEIETFTGSPYQYEECDKLHVFSGYVYKGYEYQNYDKLRNMNKCPMNISFTRVTKNYNNGHFGYDEKSKKYVGLDLEFMESELISFYILALFNFFKKISLSSSGTFNEFRS